MNTPVIHSLRSFTPPLKGAKPVARQSRFDGVCWTVRLTLSNLGN
jgi:hypothetical protein